MSSFETTLPSAISKSPGSGIAPTPKAPEPAAAAAGFEILPRSMSSRALETAIAPAWVRSSMLSLTVMKPLLVPSFDRNSNVGSVRFIEEFALKISKY